MVESTDSVNGMVIDQVQLADIEDAAHVPSGSDIVGKQVGNMMWRSPEGHAQGPVNKPSDMFSFGIVVSESERDKKSRTNQPTTNSTVCSASMLC